MSLLLCNLPGYGLTREMTSRTEALAAEVENQLAAFADADVIHTLFKTGKFRVVAHRDSFPAAVKRIAGTNAVRFAAVWEQKTDTVWIDAALRHNPGFKADVIATAAFAHRAAGDDLLESYLENQLSRLYGNFGEIYANRDQYTDILDILFGVRFLRGARTADSPAWQNRVTWSVAVVMLEKLKDGKTLDSSRRDAGFWHRAPVRKTLRRLGMGLTVPPELALLRLKDWADGKLKNQAARRPGILNPFTRCGEPLFKVVGRAANGFPTLSDWFGTDDIPQSELPSGLTPFTGPDEALQSPDESDGIHFQPPQSHPLGSYDVRPAAVLRTTASAGWKRDAAGKLQAVLLKNSLESWGDTEVADGPVYPFIATERETPVVISGVAVEDNLTEAYYSVSIGRKTVKPSDRYTVYAAGWSRQATLLRAGVPLTCHLVFWALGNLPEAPGLKNIDMAFYRRCGVVKSIKNLGVLGGRRYSAVSVAWTNPEFKNVPVIMPVASASHLTKGDKIAPVGILVAGAFFHHTPVTAEEDRVRWLPPSRRDLKNDGTDETVARLRRRWTERATYENALAYAATMRPFTRRARAQRREWLLHLRTPAALFLAAQQMLADTEYHDETLPAVIYTAGQFLAAGFPPAVDWLLDDRHLSIVQRIPGLLAGSLLTEQLVHAPSAKLLAFFGEQLLQVTPRQPHDEAEALHWLMTAAARGSVPAQLRAAECCARGIGCPASVGKALSLLTLLLRNTGNPQIFYFVGGLQLLGEAFYDADAYERRRAILERVKNPGRTGDWILLILHLIYDEYPETEGYAPRAAAVALAQWIMERTGVSTAAPLLKLARTEMQSAQEEEGAHLARDFTPWTWLGIKEPTEPLTFASLINPISDALMRSLQSEAFFDDLTDHIGEDHEESFLQFVEEHVVRMSPGLAKETDNPSSDGIELGAYVGIADTGHFAGSTPALGCVRAGDKTKAGKSFYFPFFPEGLPVTFRPEEAYSTHENAAGFLRIELQDENGFPVKSLVAFDPLWPLLWRTYEPHQNYRGVLAGVAEKVFTPPEELKAERFYAVFEDTLTEAPATAGQAGLYAAGGKLESIETDYAEIAGLTVAKLTLTFKLGGREWRHFPVFISKARLELSFPKGLPAAGSLIFTEVNLHCLTLARKEPTSYAGYTLQ